MVNQCEPPYGGDPRKQRPNFSIYKDFRGGGSEKTDLNRRDCDCTPAPMLPVEPPPWSEKTDLNRRDCDIDAVVGENAPITE